VRLKAQGFAFAAGSASLDGMARMLFARRLSGLLGLALLANSPALAQSKTRASLLLEAEAARPGDTVMAAVRLQMAKGWHTYWRNPGESGKATEITWKLPAGVTAGAILWPPPEIHVASEMTTYVYHDEVWLLVPLKLDPALRPGTGLELAAEVDWLECEVACVPGNAKVNARLEMADTPRASEHAAAFAAWRQRIPQPNPALSARARWGAPGAGGKAELVIEGSVLPDFVPGDFLAYESADFEVTPAVKSLPAAAGQFRLSKPVNLFGEMPPTRLSGLLVEVADRSRISKAVEVDLALGSGETAPGASPAATSGTAGGPPGQKMPWGTSLLAMLGLAFLGGLILNVMPCVLPVIALKVLGFVQQSRADPTQARRLGLIYALGVLVSFWALAGAVILVRQAGGEASWGMQMQNPVFRVVLLTVVTLVALNLFGVFEVLLPGVTSDAAAGLASKQGAAGAFFHGVLATALATPCTAPFLAVALGFAFTQPPGLLLVFFTMVALGLAAPYVALSWRPGWLRYLPKPGPWMVRFKVAMGFPMLATAVWLLDFSAPAFGEDGLLWLGMHLVILALAGWIWGEFVQRGAGRRARVAAVCLGLLAADYLGVLEHRLQWRQPRAAAGDTVAVTTSPEGLNWAPWSPERVADARRAGRIVVVDFTAKWCLTCQANKRFALDTPEVRARLKSLNALTLRADNTNPNPLITAALKQHGRAGVPLVLVYPKYPDRPPLVLPEVLTPTIVLNALAEADATVPREDE
jgi:thiol:disulfide interchange protein DsbD